MFPVSTRAGSVVPGFPDACRTPTPGGPVPVPYPVVSGSAGPTPASQSGIAIGSRVTPVSASNFHLSTGDEPGAAHLGTSSSNAPVTPQQLRNRLAMLHGELMTMAGGDKRRWHLKIEEYVVTAAALYFALTER